MERSSCKVARGGLEGFVHNPPQKTHNFKDKKNNDHETKYAKKKEKKQTYVSKDLLILSREYMFFANGCMPNPRIYTVWQL